MEDAISASWNKLAKGLLAWFSPDSLAFSDLEQKYTMKKFSDSEALRQKVEPGDLILTRTPSSMYDIIRKGFGVKFDHLAVAVSPTECLHISPPRVRLIPTQIFLMKKRMPAVLRVRCSKETRQKLVELLKQHIGEEYSYFRVLQLMINLGLRRRHVDIKTVLPGLESPKFDRTNICTDLVGYYMRQLSKEFEEDLSLLAPQLDLTRVNSFTVDDFMIITQHGSSLEAVHIEPVTLEELIGDVNKQQGPAQNASTNIMAVPSEMMSKLQFGAAHFLGESGQDISKLIETFSEKLNNLLGRTQAAQKKGISMIKILEGIYVILAFKRLAFSRSKHKASGLARGVEFMKALVEALTFMATLERFEGLMSRIMPKLPKL